MLYGGYNELLEWKDVLRNLFGTYLKIYSQTCVEQPPQGKLKSGCSSQVVAFQRLTYEDHESGLCSPFPDATDQTSMILKDIIFHIHWQQYYIWREFETQSNFKQSCQQIIYKLKQAISAREQALCQLTMCFEFHGTSESTKGHKGVHCKWF